MATLKIGWAKYGPFSNRCLKIRSIFKHILKKYPILQQIASNSNKRMYTYTYTQVWSQARGQAALGPKPLQKAWAHVRCMHMECIYAWKCMYSCVVEYRIGDRRLPMMETYLPLPQVVWTEVCQGMDWLLAAKSPLFHLQSRGFCLASTAFLGLGRKDQTSENAHWVTNVHEACTVLDLQQQFHP